MPMSRLELTSRLRKLGPRQIFMLLEAAAELAVATWRVKRGGPALSRLLQAPGINAVVDEDAAHIPQQTLDQVAWAINAVGRRLPRDPSCLMRALAARAMLARRGISCSIRIGISEDSENFRAHAWVEAGTRPVVGWIAGERFAVLAQIR
jgi:hypothetical protein